MSLCDVVVPADKHTRFLFKRRRNVIRFSSYVGKTMEEVIDNDIHNSKQHTWICLHAGNLTDLFFGLDFQLSSKTLES